MASGGGRLSSFDPSAPTSTPLLQVDTLMGTVTTLFAALAQMSPRDFLPDKYVGRRISGIRAERYLLFPASAAGLVYCAISVQLVEGNFVRGHTAGLATSAVLSACCAKYFSVSPWYWALFTMYSLYGVLYHGRRMTLYTDGAPWWDTGDAPVVWAAWREDRRKAKEEKAAKKVRRAGRVVVPDEQL